MFASAMADVRGPAAVCKEMAVMFGAAHLDDGLRKAKQPTFRGHDWMCAPHCIRQQLQCKELDVQSSSPTCFSQQIMRKKDCIPMRVVTEMH
mmetsp:Transcript_49817/g.118742  ORF Transcript_49817/g.118742 Transcript_49817/m.118742 type:complete len:92 (+) Transcript_49817:792-1067(+)